MRTITFEPKDIGNMTGILSKVYNIGTDDFKQSTDPRGNILINVDDSGRRYDSKVFITLEKNSIEGYLSIYPPIGTGNGMTEEEIFAAIAEDGVSVNLDTEAVKKIADRHERGIVVEHELIAKGIEPHAGKDAVIMLQFSDVDKKPKIGADGKVDYKNIDNISHARKGDVLISKRPATMGVRGMSVKNVEIRPTPGKDIEIFQGEGVMLNPLGTQYVALQDGYIEFKSNVLSVHQVLFVKKDVDFSTGNISFSGTVHVKGDVLSGFRVEAKRDVIVDGICGDCEIIAHNDLIVKTGIKGNENNLFMAKGNATIGYAEKAHIQARGDIVIKKYVYNSDLYAGGNIDATAGEGIVAGGVLRAFSEVSAKQLGTQGNSKFNIYLGTKYYIDPAVEKIRKEKVRLLETVTQINDLLKRFNLVRPEVANNPKIVKLQDMRRACEAVVAEMGEKED
ncbi:MAG: FapA family protein, partial [Deferribacteraceae bacterium]|nr:FapA family protein [Deferribacteraceae bacterium]